MRIAILILLGLALAGMTGCAGDFYDDMGNWVIRNNEIPGYSSEYDVFFLYSTQVKHTSGDTLNWEHEGLELEIRRYATALVADLVRYRARVFSPFVPQLGFDNYSKLLDAWKNSPEKFNLGDGPLAPAIRHTVLALKYYMKHYNDGRPFILIGHEQGAVVLYEALKQVSDISPQNGCAAVYFQGLPGITVERLRKDLGSRGFAPAAGRYDFGAVVVTNTCLPGEKPAPAPDACVINPLNWRLDTTPASRKENPESIFYIRNSGKSRRIPNYCGAAADPEKGVVMLTDIPAKPRLELRGHVFPSDVWGIFAGSVSRNAGERIREYLFRRNLKKIQ